MMANNSRPAKSVFATIVAVCMIGSSPAAPGADIAPEIRPPAGQMCPDGSYVIGFDSEANIICSEASPNGVLYPDASTGDGSTEIGDNCSEKCNSEEADTGSTGEPIAAEIIQADPGRPPSLPEPVITVVKPSSVVYGASEVKITISGTGFSAESVIIFAGSRYSPSVNQAGTRLDVTIPTRNLVIGSYAITVSNGPGMETTRKKALAVF